ncbi:flagellar basal body P-ring formation chaperone FlgA [Colwellia sp. 4_MG-2023]|jgi:flagella basal body P-ring formation protein FlgA|uniref:flagellar basal body P-ring formation chaperone FlgA n=1 Tax=unclassified Colwellia TaxID=196834 RepID=UPI001C093BD2|nr:MULTISPECIES: flagellar basal body P-ring formation chaperone FlgA [unclassified Colwellia]MBU2925589.1 flagellar basal body P-ring formation chaperone FlgA [Colwellia sp. C2M11]MDO6486382.1 flagellar basal body P-ring formation chaperone FlgA [Colwellia sp. 6_MG-2023]MDO6505680.1 flagellar basal body P-ring formation chaperone FlgA [Colwellia sp. 5_MG-2023]MDO6554361.1 flagellar basal body P-ring formation chaperone FlgA [Colwellia sp. 4_MG-2023]MDO6654049.1 flagellar basal body P-ring for
MTYYLGHLKNNQQTEVKLPHRNYLYFLYFVMSCFIGTTQANSINFEQESRHYINQEIARFLSYHGAISQQQKINLFIPKGSEDLECTNLQISRSKPSSVPAGRIRLTIKCDSPKWQFRASAKVDLWMNLVVAKRDLQRGEILTADLLDTRSLNIASHLHGMEVNINNVIGMQVRRDINSGDVINRRLLEKQYLVNRDQHVELHVSTPTFNASVTAIALEDGQLGQRIKVKNLTSGQVVEGQVIGKGTVKIFL